MATSENSPTIAELAVSPQEPAEERSWIKIALLADIAIVLLTWTLLVLGLQGAKLIPIPDVIVVGTALMLVAFITFGGFYLASPATATSRDPWMRNAIAATFVMFYLFLFSLLIVGSEVREWILDDGTQSGAETFSFGVETFNGFTTFVGLVIGFYFATQAVERVTDAVQSGQTTRAAIAQQPELAQKVLNEQQRASYRGGPPF
jgi:hypothetical protein